MTIHIFCPPDVRAGCAHVDEEGERSCTDPDNGEGTVWHEHFELLETSVYVCQDCPFRDDAAEDHEIVIRPTVGGDAPEAGT